MTTYIRNNQNKNTTIGERFYAVCVSFYGNQKALAKGASISLPMAEKRRQGVVPDKTLNELEALTRDLGPAFVLELLGSALADFAANQEAKAHATRQQYEQLIQLHQRYPVGNSLVDVSVGDVDCT